MSSAAADLGLPGRRKVPVLISFRRRIRRGHRALAQLADSLSRRIVARLAQHIRAREVRFHKFGDQLETPALGRPGSKIVAEQTSSIRPGPDSRDGGPAADRQLDAGTHEATAPSGSE
jgi:hypothetical protein